MTCLLFSLLHTQCDHCLLDYAHSHSNWLWCHTASAMTSSHVRRTPKDCVGTRPVYTYRGKHPMPESKTSCCKNLLWSRSLTIRNVQQIYWPHCDMQVWQLQYTGQTISKHGLTSIFPTALNKTKDILTGKQNFLKKINFFLFYLSAGSWQRHHHLSLTQPWAKQWWHLQRAIRQDNLL